MDGLFWRQSLALPVTDLSLAGPLTVNISGVVVVEVGVWCVDVTNIYLR